MAGKVLTEEDFQEGQPEKKDTSKTPPPDEIIEGKEEEEPERKEEPSKDKEEPQPEPEEKKYKHSTWDETEKARVEAERKMHEATTEAADLKKRVAQYEKPKEVVNLVDERAKELRKETMQKIKTLPADSPTRDDDAADVWGEYTRKVARLELEEDRRRENSDRSNAKKLYGQATKEGLKSDIELDMVGQEFSRTDPSLPMEDRVSSAVDATKTKIASLREGLVEKPDPEKLEKDRKDKESLKVLGRGSSRQGKSEEDDKKGPTSMSQQLAELNEKRRLKKDDLWR